MNKLVSVIIPMFNAERWIEETLASVQTQTYPRQLIEIIVVNDHSTDRSAEIIRQKFPEAILVTTEGKGASQARNSGTRIARGEFIQYLDADDLLIRDKLARQVNALENTGADVAYGDWQGLILGEDSVFKPGDVMERRMEQEPEIALLLDFWCPPAAYLFRRGIVERVGGWNENLPVIQDARFALDCALHDAGFTYCRGVVAYYRVHSQSSLSRRDPAAFIADCFRNACEVEQWFYHHGGLTETRRAALVRVFEQVARATYENNPEAFEAAYGALNRLTPGGYTPSHPKHLALAAKLIGYRRAEGLALTYRRSKALLKVSSGRRRSTSPRTRS